MDRKRQVFKYPLALAEVVELDIPEGGRVLTLGVQQGIPMLWVLVDVVQPMERRTFITVGTGHEVPWATTFVGTWFDGPYVWHVFEKQRVRGV